MHAGAACELGHLPILLQRLSSLAHTVGDDDCCATRDSALAMDQYSTLAVVTRASLVEEVEGSLEFAGFDEV